MAVSILPPVVVTVPYEELAAPQESPTESSTLTSFKATRYLKCAWANRRLLSQQLKGTITNSGTDLIVTSPQSYPDVPAAGVTQVDIAPWQGINPTAVSPTQIQWDYALLTVQYSTGALANLNNGSGSDAVVTEDLEPWSEFLTLSNRSLFWGSSGLPLSIEESPGLLVKGMTWVYRRHFVQTVPDAVLTLPGKCNDSVLFAPTLGLTFQEETLLYTPPRLAIDTDSGGNRTITLEHRFNHREKGWNKFYNKATKNYEEILDENDDVVKVFEPASFLGIVG